MWTVVYLAQSRELADEIAGMLEKKEILFKIKPVGEENGSEGEGYEILVPFAEVEQAHGIIIDSEF